MGSLQDALGDESMTFGRLALSWEELGAEEGDQEVSCEREHLGVFQVET